jgi:hypothetical protein
MTSCARIMDDKMQSELKNAQRPAFCQSRGLGGGGQFCSPPLQLVSPFLLAAAQEAAPTG